MVICLPRNTGILDDDLFGQDSWPRNTGILIVNLFGQEYWSNPFFGWGDFFVEAEGLQTGPVFGTFIFLVIIAIS